MNTVIVANGTFPIHFNPLSILKNADFIIACDGAADKLIEFGVTPNIIIGDLDSVSEKVKNQYKNIITHVSSQENTDLMKAIDWCIANNKYKVDILGATGGREDHTIGNVFILTKYCEKLDVKMITDTGSFVAMNKTTEFDSYKGQQISLFPQPLLIKITTKGLKYSLTNQCLEYLSSGTLNESLGNSFKIIIDEGKMIVYRTF